MVAEDADGRALGALLELHRGLVEGTAPDAGQAEAEGLIPADVMAAAGGDLVRPGGVTLPIGRLRRVLRGWLKAPADADPRKINYWQVHLGVHYRVMLEPEAVRAWRGHRTAMAEAMQQALATFARSATFKPSDLPPPRGFSYPPHRGPDDLKPTAAEVEALIRGVVAGLRPTPYVPLTAQTVLLRDLPETDRRFVVRLGYFSTDHQSQTFQLVKDATRLAVAERLAYYLTVLHLGSAESVTLRTTDSDQGGLRRLANQILPAWFDPVTVTDLSGAPRPAAMLSAIADSLAAEGLGEDDLRRTIDARTLAWRHPIPLFPVPAAKTDRPIRITDSHRRQMAILLSLALDDVRMNARKLVGQALRYEIIGPSRREHGDAERTSYNFRALTDRVTELDGTRALSPITVFKADLPSPEVPLVVPMEDFELVKWLQIIQLVNTGRMDHDEFASKIAEPLPQMAAALNWDRDRPHADYIEPARFRRELLIALGSVLRSAPTSRWRDQLAAGFSDLAWAVSRDPDFIRLLPRIDEVITTLLPFANTESQLPSPLLKPVILLVRTYAIGDSKENRFEEAAGRALSAVDRAIFLMDQLDKNSRDRSMIHLPILEAMGLSLLAAAGVFVRAAESAVIRPPYGPIPARGKSPARHVTLLRNFATSAWTLTKLANRVFVVIAHAVRDRIVANDPLPPTARPSAAAMLMRTTMLHAAVELAFDRSSSVRTLVDTLGEICRRTLAESGELFNTFTYGDMTRAVMLHCLLVSAETVANPLHEHKIDPAKLRDDLPALFAPATAEITLAACGQYLRLTGADAGMLDQIRTPELRALLNDGDGLDRWLADYEAIRVRVRNPESLDIVGLLRRIDPVDRVVRRSEGVLPN